MIQGCLDEPPIIKNGSYKKNPKLKPPFPVYTKFFVDCDLGFRTINPLLHCQPDNTWSNVKCFPVSCGHPGYIDHGKFEGNIWTFQKEGNIKWVCDEGYKLVNATETQYCSPDGTWQPPIKPSCVPLKCPKLTAPKNGRIILSQNGTFATYECDKSYQLVGDKERECTQSEIWTGKPPTCEPYGCPYPGDLTNGTVFPKNKEGSIYRIGSILNYICNNSDVYATLKCMGDGSWSRKLPKCPSSMDIDVSQPPIIDVPPPPIIDVPPPPIIDVPPPPIITTNIQSSHSKPSIMANIIQFFSNNKTIIIFIILSLITLCYQMIMIFYTFNM